MSKDRRLFRVKFIEKGESESTTVVVETFEQSEHLGLVAMSGFVFSDQTKLVLLPEEDAVRKRFAKTTRLHLPYHVLLSVEEFTEKPADLKNLPFIKPIEKSSDDDSSK